MSDFPLRMIKCGGLFQLIVHRLLELKQDGGENLHIVKIKRYLLEHYTQTVTVEMAADEAGLNPVYCGALFKRHTGMSILEYLNRLRVGPEQGAAGIWRGTCGGSCTTGRILRTRIISAGYSPDMPAVRRPSIYAPA